MIYRDKKRGSIDASTLIIVGLVVLLLGVGGLAIWSYMQYEEKRSDVDGQVSIAVAEAKKEQAEEDEVKIQAARENPYIQFVGPSDYGRVTFDYPRNWSAYIDKDASKGGDFEAYLNPVTVPPVSQRERYALRVTIEDKTYENVLQTYKSLVERGDLKTTNVNINDINGTRIDGAFSKEIRGSAVVFKIRDKTLIVQTDAETFKPYFDKIIKTIEFNK